jgi:hypothetical protein
MTLDEVIARSKTPPKKGDHEVVMGPDGLGHLVVLVNVKVYDENGGGWKPPSFSFMGRCEALNSNGDVGALEIAPTITCMQCMQW